MMTPENEAALAEAIRSANRPISIQGGGTRGVVAQGEVISTQALSGVTLYEPGALTLVAQAGTPVAEVERVLAEQGQRLAFEPMDHRALMGTDGEPTIGGICAANVSGPRRIQAGAARDFTLGVRFIDGAGEVVKNGGRVMKNVTGYDLVKLMCGSWGTLGVLTEVSLKVLPIPETETTLIQETNDPAEAVTVMSNALGSPFDVTGAAWDGARVMVRLEGFADSVAYRAGVLGKSIGVDSESNGEKSKENWQQVRDVSVFSNADGDVWRVSVKPSDGPNVIAQAGAEQALMDWGGGLVWLRMAPGTDLRARMGGISGHATLVRGTSQARFHPEPAAIAALTANLRAKFDPRGILNAGLMADAA